MPLRKKLIGFISCHAAALARGEKPCHEHSSPLPGWWVQEPIPHYPQQQQAQSTWLFVDNHASLIPFAAKLFVASSYFNKQGVKH